MPTFQVTLAYDGTDYIGWQRQASGTSIQGLLEDAVRALAGCDVPVTGAGRTDAGVHALGQVAAFTIERAIDPATVVRALNARLPADVRVLSARASAADFHPRFDARAKTYRYRIWNHDVVSPFERRYVWHVLHRLDVESMERAARMLEGCHDFASFQATGADVSTTVREVTRSSVSRRVEQSALVIYEISGTGFLRHMVRNIVGSLVDVGRGRRSPEWMGVALASRDRTQAGGAAPASGLFLVSVDY